MKYNGTHESTCMKCDSTLIVASRYTPEEELRMDTEEEEYLMYPMRHPCCGATFNWMFNIVLGVKR